MDGEGCVDGRCQARTPAAALIDWVQIEGGRFQMGSSDGNSDEQPVHAVQVPAFELARVEVTVWTGGRRQPPGRDSRRVRARPAHRKPGLPPCEVNPVN